MVGGVNQRTIYICSDHICACRGVNSGRHDSPYIRKLSLDHDSGEKNRGCHKNSKLGILRRLCPSPSPNLLMPGVTAQMNPNQHHEQESSSQAPVVQPLNIRSIQSLDHCMSFWHVLEWLQESFLTRGTIMYSWIAQKRSLGFLVKNASDTSKRQKIPLRGLQVPLWGHL